MNGSTDRAGESRWRGRSQSRRRGPRSPPLPVRPARLPGLLEQAIDEFPVAGEPGRAGPIAAAIGLEAEAVVGFRLPLLVPGQGFELLRHQLGVERAGLEPPLIRAAGAVADGPGAVGVDVEPVLRR